MLYVHMGRELSTETSPTLALRFYIFLLTAFVIFSLAKDFVVMTDRCISMGALIIKLD